MVYYRKNSKFPVYSDNKLLTLIFTFAVRHNLIKHQQVVVPLVFPVILRYRYNYNNMVNLKVFMCNNINSIIILLHYVCNCLLIFIFLTVIKSCEVQQLLGQINLSVQIRFCQTFDAMVAFSYHSDFYGFSEIIITNECLCCTVGMAPKEPSIFNGHVGRAQFKICCPSPVMVTSPYERKILQWRKKQKKKNINKKI